MENNHLLSTMLCASAVLLSSTVSSAAALDEHRTMARWLTEQLHRPVEASQIIVSPNVAALEGCTIARAHRENTGSTSLSVRCPGYILPQLVLLNLPAELDAGLVAPAVLPGRSSPRVMPLVRAGVTLSADWRTEFLHAQLPVVALDSGAVGAEIRVRIAQTNRIMHARIIDAHSVTIVVAGA